MYLDFRNKIDYEKLKEAAQIIKNGGLVVFPTETVYGIGTNGLNKKAIKSLYKIKQRPLNKPICLLVNSINMIESVAKDITDIEYALMKKFFPGPLTIILKKKDIVPDVLNNTGHVGVRMPTNEIAYKLVEYSQVPIAAPSANITGQPSGVTFTEAFKSFGKKVDCFIDGGLSEFGISSTIVQVIDNVPHIIRKGIISEEQIQSVCTNNKLENHF